ncbi:hypothetical protein [Streptomyces sp. NPDC051776]|uniref:hypothetical protein n=1 Tax=Streptomyces sp. NPDC051776 TaxID=3155414 RepID=UPI00343EE533
MLEYAWPLKRAQGQGRSQGAYPTALTELLDQLETQLTTLADQAPLAALDRLTRRVGRDAAYAAEADELSPETIATALGLSPDKACSRLTGYLLRR